MATKQNSQPTDIVPAKLIPLMSSLKSSASAWHPWPYQGLGLKYVLEEPFSGLLLDPGMGKTSIMYAATKLLMRKKTVKRHLVIAPKRPLYETWPLEKCEWTDFHDISIAMLHGSNKELILRELAGSKHQLVLMNPESFLWLMEDGIAKFKALGADMLTIDESSKWKNSQSQRFKRMRKQLVYFKRRHILTGTPRPNNYLDLFSQIYLVDRGHALGEFVTHYKAEYFYPTGDYGREWALLPGAEKRINAKIAGSVMRLEATDYLDLPSVPPDRIHKVDLPDAVRAEYDRIEDGLLSALFTQPLTHSSSARQKCCQIANGAVYIDKLDPQHPSAARKVKYIHDEKVEALADIVEELQGEPILVGIGYHHDVTHICQYMNLDIPVINSGTSDRLFNDIMRKWNAGKLPVLLGHPASMGHGLNMQKCDGRHVCFFDIPDDYDNYDQMFRRVWRQGNKARFVFKHHIVARATVDVAKMYNLSRKGKGQAGFLAAMKEYTIEKYGKHRVFAR